MRIQLIDARLALRNSTTRLPFRYGSACLTWCPQAVMRAELAIDGARQFGYSGDCLPPSWFDKTPGKDYSQQIDDMLAVIDVAGEVFRGRFERPTEFFLGWYEAQAEVHRQAASARGQGCWQVLETA